MCKSPVAKGYLMVMNPQDAVSGIIEFIEKECRRIRSKQAHQGGINCIESSFFYSTLHSSEICQQMLANVQRAAPCGLKIKSTALNSKHMDSSWSRFRQVWIMYYKLCHNRIYYTQRFYKDHFGKGCVKKGKGGIIALIIIIFVVIAAAGTAGFLYFTSEGYQIEKNMKQLI